MVFLRAFLLSLLMLLTASSVLSAKEVIIVGDDAYPPYSYIENGQAKGIYVDVLKKVFEKIDGYEVTFKMIPWKRCIKGIKEGKYVAFFPPYHAEHREAWTEFSEPILQEQTVVFGKKEMLKGKTKWPEDFYNTKIGLNDGFNPESMAGKKFATAVEMGMIKVDNAKDNLSNLKKLNKGRIDFYLSDKMIDTSQFPEIERGIVAKNNWGYLGFTKKDLNFSEYLNDLKIKFNEAVKKTKASGEVQKIIDANIK